MRHLWGRPGGRASASHRGRRRARDPDRHDAPSRSRRPRDLHRRRDRDRRASPERHGPGARRAADLLGGRSRLGRAERRALQPGGLARATAARRPRPAHALRHRGDPAPLRGARARLHRPPRGHVRDRGLGRAPAPRGGRARPRRREADVLDVAGGRRRIRVRAEEPDQVRRARRAGRGRDRGIPHARLRSRPADAVSRHQQARARPPPRRRGRQRPRRALVDVPRACARVARARTGHLPRRAPRAAERVRADATRGGRARRRDAERRPRLEPRRRARLEVLEHAAEDVRRRLAREQRACRRTPDRGALRHRALRARAVARRHRADAARARLPPGRAARRPVGDRLLRALAARARARHRCALRPGRGRAVRRLPQARRGCRSPARSPRGFARLPAYSRHMPRPRCSARSRRSARATRASGCSR